MHRDTVHRCGRASPVLYLPAAQAHLQPHDGRVVALVLAAGRGAPVTRLDDASRPVPPQQLCVRHPRLPAPHTPLSDRSPAAP